MKNLIFDLVNSFYLLNFIACDETKYHSDFRMTGSVNIPKKGLGNWG